MACQKFVFLIGEKDTAERKKERKGISSIFNVNINYLLKVANLRL
jgi:hypothetical protein